MKVMKAFAKGILRGIYVAGAAATAVEAWGYNTERGESHPALRSAAAAALWPLLAPAVLVAAAHDLADDKRKAAI